MFRKFSELERNAVINKGIITGEADAKALDADGILWGNIKEDGLRLPLVFFQINNAGIMLFEIEGNTVESFDWDSIEVEDNIKGNAGTVRFIS